MLPRASSSLSLVPHRGGTTHRLLSSSSSSPTTTKSPWQRFLDYFTFRPGAPGYAMYPRQATAGQGYRFPSPGAEARGDVKVPSVPIGDDLVYNTQYYTRDTRRNKPPAVVFAKDMQALPFPEKGLPPLGSPGRHNVNVAMYDPSGSRSAMTTNHKAMNAALEKQRPGHLPQAAWRRDAAAIERMLDEAEKNQVPVAVGLPVKTTNVTDKIVW